MSKYSLARCELFSKKNHGDITHTYKECINGKIICMESIDLIELNYYIKNNLWKDSMYYILNNIDLNKIKWAMGKSKDSPYQLLNKICKNNINLIYSRIGSQFNDPYFNKINIIQKINIYPINENYNDYYYTTSIIKTFWIKLIQRKWKNIYKERRRIITARISIKNLHYREIHGKWPIGLNYLPGIQDLKI
tara:strand:+ start:39 stop:614 length:576 start_codon:yes stop_codon:yes gene_type:complete